MTTLELTLPNGFLDNGVLIRDLEVRKLNGEDEDMLRDSDNLRQGNVVDKLLKRVITRVGTYVDDAKIVQLYDSSFLMADMTYVLIKLRTWSIDEVYRFDYQCGTCGYMGHYNTKLDELPIDEQPEEYRGVAEISSVANGLPFKHRQLKTGDQRMLESIKIEYKKEKGTRELILQVLEIDGKKPTPPMLKKLDWKTRLALRNMMDKTVGGIDTQLAITCSRCERTVKEMMPIQIKPFFFPAEETFECPMASPFRVYGGTQPSSRVNGDGALGTSAG